MAIVLGAEIGKRVTVSDNGSAPADAGHGDYFIEGSTGNQGAEK